MNWGRIKTIFIILFLISDLFLLGILVISEWKQGTTSPEVVASTMQILDTNGISISPDIIPKKVENAPYAEAENIITGYDSFAEMLLGDSASKNQDNVYESQAGIVTFFGNSFDFSSAEDIQNAAITGKEAEIIAAEFLSELGLNLKNAKKNTEKTSDGYSVVFVNTINGLPVFNNSVTVKISGKSVTHSFGEWFNPLDIRGPESDLKSVTSMLIDSISSFNAEYSKVTIDSLSMGYSIPDSNTYHKSAVLIPVWEVGDTTGKVYYFDARNPQ